MADIASGVSDPEVFEVCQERDITLKVHSRIHAKVYSWDLETGLLGSANLTDSGMGMSQNPNVEVLSKRINLPTETQLKLRKAENEAKLVTVDDYERVTEYLKESDIQEPDYEDIDLGREPEFLVSQLPMTENPDLLIDVLASDCDKKLEEMPDEELRCVLHDIATFNLNESRGQSRERVSEAVGQNFEDHPFIKLIIDNMDPYIYFGEMKELVQNECNDVPTPTRRDLTYNIQVLYDWFVQVSPDRFEHDVPGSHSERLCDKTKK
jgi:hypothetical protein